MVKFAGLDKVKGSIQAAREIAVGNVLLGKLQPTTHTMLDELIARAQEQVPVDTGLLRSEVINAAQIHSTSLDASITFGGLAAAYASVQHNRENFLHPGGGTDHFLFGKSHSAWEAGERDAEQLFDRDASDVADKYISKAGK